MFAIFALSTALSIAGLEYADVDMSTELTSVNTVQTTSAMIALPLVSPFCPHRKTKTKHASSEAQFRMLVAVESFDVVSNFANGIAILGSEIVIDFAWGIIIGDAVGVGGGAGRRVGSTTYVAIYIRAIFYFEYFFSNNS